LPLGVDFVALPCQVVGLWSADPVSGSRMTASLTLSLTPHPQRAAVLSEVHARPFHALQTPRRLLSFAFMTTPEQSSADRQALSAFCEARGLGPVPGGAKHHFAAWPGTSLRWEQHTEFTTYTWEMDGGSGRPFMPQAGTLAGIMNQVPQPGALLSAIDLHLLPQSEGAGFESLYDSASLAVSQVSGGAATAATDFRADAEGFVRILVLDKSLTAPRAGALAQRLIEIETYRILALLGLPEAQSLAPRVRRIEEALTRVGSAMTEAEGLATDHRLLDELTSLAATLEADTAASSYRFGASRAYDEIVQQRLAAIRETSVENWPTLASFLARRMAPAMRTCTMLENRLAQLSEKLSRTSNLLRTRVDVEIERQNRDVLVAMNERTRLQLRLQQTVEGLSVAAISYYVVSLASYIFKGAKDAGVLPMDPGTATALSVPVAVLGVWGLVRRLRRSPDKATG
jgi:uncharacterized membrane-anchored protein